MDDYINLGRMRESIENELMTLVHDLVPVEYEGMLPLLTYHMGWNGDGAGPDAQGKRIRPLLVLL